MAFASLLTGTVQSLGTTWGLFRHYWVPFKLPIIVIAIVPAITTWQKVTALTMTGTLSPMITFRGGTSMASVREVLGHPVRDRDQQDQAGALGGDQPAEPDGDLPLLGDG